MKSPCEKYLRSSLFSFIGYQPKYNFSLLWQFLQIPVLCKNSTDRVFTSGLLKVQLSLQLGKVGNYIPFFVLLINNHPAFSDRASLWAAIKIFKRTPFSAANASMSSMGTDEFVVCKK